MLWIIILSAMVLAGIVIIAVCECTGRYGAEGFGWFISAIFGTALLLVLLSLTGIKSDFQSFKNDYQFTKELLETYEPGIDYGNTSSVASKVLDINTKIAKHRAQWNSPWYNLWRDKEIGELEPLKLPSKKTIEKNETTDN